MGIFLCTTDCCFNYPDTVILLLSKDDEKDLEAELAGTNKSIVEFNTIGCDQVIPSNVIVSAEDITEKVRLLRDSIIEGRVCARCKSLLLPTFTRGYRYQCSECDEDLFEIETIPGEYSPERFQKFLLDFFANGNLNEENTFNILNIQKKQRKKDE